MSRLVKPIRLLLKIFFFFLEAILGFFEKVQGLVVKLFFKSEYVRKGACGNSGQCCQAIGIEFPRSWKKYPRFLKTIEGWYYLKNNFRATGYQDNLMVLSCGYLTKDNKCGIHRFKPKLCRDFPITPLFGITKLHKGCGYYFEKRKGQDFGRILKEQIQKDENL